MHRKAVLTQIDPLTRLREAIAPVRDRLATHALYREVQTIHHLQIFMESHVFAVWDFMSLLKWLQAEITCVKTPWLPSPYPRARRLINEIVLCEESDTYGNESVSHFELYLKAMAEAGAGTFAVRSLMAELSLTKSVPEALESARPPREAHAFVKATFDLLQQNKPHVTAAAFTFGREDLIPEMFQQFVKDLRKNLHSVGTFEYYLDRHIEMDGDSHGPMALQMVEELCGFDDKKWDEAAAAAQTAIEARIALWDGILERIRTDR